MNKGMLIVTHLATFICLALILTGIAITGSLPDTGQTKCYDNSQEISCPSPGEPFYGQDTQYPCNPHSYTKLDENGNDLSDTATEWVMVRDNVTGLIWEVKTDNDPPDIHDKDNTYNWQNAQDVFIATINSQNFGGHSDWRLPTVKELSTLVDSSVPYTGPTINTGYFPNTVSSYHWSSTTLAYDPRYVWGISFDLGYVGHADKPPYFHVRAVRGGQSFNNFVDNGNGTITDTSTGLMWQQDTAPGTYNWQQALSYCETLTLADYDDWRLPNRNELQSLVDYSQYDPSINTAFFPNTVSCGPDGYWSSTTEALYQINAWYVDFNEGNVSPNGKTTSDYYVRAVRGGQCGSFGDSDNDGIPDDGDNSGSSSDNPCTGGNTENCDDNCIDAPNSDQADMDIDGIGDVCDNCPNHPNSLDLGTCVKTKADMIASYRVGEPKEFITCSSDADCEETGGTCQLEQGDSNGNGCGDVCECYMDCNNDGAGDSKVTGADLAVLKQEYGRFDCSELNPCYADGNEDGKVTGLDLMLSKNEYGRFDCPACP